VRRCSAPAGNCTLYDSRRGLLCSYGSVYVGRQRDGSGAPFAVKALPLVDGDEGWTSVASEVAQLQQCANANVVRYLSSTCVNAHLWILMELCACSIRDVMNAKGAALEEEQIAVVCRESLQGTPQTPWRRCLTPPRLQSCAPIFKALLICTVWRRCTETSSVATFC